MKSILLKTLVLLFAIHGMYWTVDGVAADTNLLLNPGFELPAIVPPATQAPGADDWTTFNTAGVQNIVRHSRKQALRLAPAGPTGTTATGIARQEFGVGTEIFINETYSLGAWVYNSSGEPITGDRKGQLRIQWYNAGGTLLNQATAEVIDANSPTDEWLFVKLENVLIPNNANITEVRASLFAVNGAGTNGGPVFFDDVTFVEGETALMGGNPELLNPGFEFPEIPGGQTQLPGADDWTTFNTAGVRNTVQHSGKQSMRLAPNGPTGTTAPGICRQEFEVGPDIFTNLPYSMGAWVYNNSGEPITGDRKGQLRIQWFDANNNLMNQAIADVADASTPTDQWIFVALENVLIPNNANIAQVRASLFAVNGAGTNGGPVFFDDVTFVQGEAAVMGGTVKGDANGDGVLTNDDILAFVQALTDPVGYAAAYPDVDPDIVLDMNDDGGFDNDDILGFVAVLTGS